MEYRLIEIEYRNRIVYDDGPGSTRDVVSDVYKRELASGTVDDDTSEEELIAFVQRRVPDRSEDEYDGWYEYSHLLQSRKEGESEWQYVAYLDYKKEG